MTYNRELAMPVTTATGITGAAVTHQLRDMGHGVDVRV
jgi:hypothetical protein